KFQPIFLEKIWGGQRMRSTLNKNFGDLPNCGESWELSGVEGHVSTVSNGFLAGNDLNELVEIYMGELVGDKVYEKFGNEFPLLVKFIDASDDLSIQVHPNDKLSKERHNAYGKTEMWYVAGAEEGALINSGFNQEVSREKYLKYLNSGRLTELLHYDEVNTGDVFFIPAGRVHAICKGCLVAEIQQTSDVTYRIFDYGRKDAQGNDRELHTDLALDAIDYSYASQYKTPYTAVLNESVPLVSCPYFTTNMLDFNQELEKDYCQLDSFVIYMALEGSFELQTGNTNESIRMGETVLLPASIESVQLKPHNKKVRALEVFIK
ncbi:MAG: type I phosphomannose isomerase catalytic subunit, partial [Draconibacterium sp.]